MKYENLLKQKIKKFSKAYEPASDYNRNELQKGHKKITHQFFQLLLYQEQEFELVPS